MPDPVDYTGTRDYLNSHRDKGVKYGLDSIRSIAGTFGHPEKKFPCIHVAGTNGKGSTCAMLEAIYRAKGVPAAQCSTGEQKALLISLVLSNARSLAEDTGLAPLILLDEVAAHLDADRRAALYQEICALGSQAWMTGTGPELFEELGSRAQTLIVTESNGTSTATRAP